VDADPLVPHNHISEPQNECFVFLATHQHLASPRQPANPKQKVTFEAPSLLNLLLFP
jgi:hypothetical protein